MLLRNQQLMEHARTQEGGKLRWHKLQRSTHLVALGAVGKPRPRTTGLLQSYRYFVRPGEEIVYSEDDEDDEEELIGEAVTSNDTPTKRGRWGRR
jgi:hypothetical protein